jgi:hypothetical protein
VPFFEQLRNEKCSLFYQKMWSELDGIKIFDTHEHYQNPEYWITQLDKTGCITPHILNGAYTYKFPLTLDYDGWALTAHDYRFTGYFRSFLWGIEELYGIEPPANSSYFEKLENQLKEIYISEEAGYDHMKEIAIQNIGFDEHFRMKSIIPEIKAACGISDILSGMFVPKNARTSVNIVYRFAAEWMHIEMNEIQSLENYCEIVKHLLEYIKNSDNYICLKNAIAYNRPIIFPEPPENTDEIRKLFNHPLKSEQDLWHFGDYMMHFILDWMQDNWKVPIQFHTGLARMLDGASNAINLSYLFQKYTELHFDLFHGNYPYYNLPGMLHQIRNISADLCWLPIISPSACQRTLTELIEIGDMVAESPNHMPMLRTSLFGGDCQNVEGSFGALLTAKDVLIRTLEDLFNRGHIITTEDALDIANAVLYENPKRIFKQ